MQGGIANATRLDLTRLLHFSKEIIPLGHSVIMHHNIGFGLSERYKVLSFAHCLFSNWKKNLKNLGNTSNFAW